MLVDTLGSGLVVPFELLFGTVVVGLPLAQTGLGLSIGTGASILIGPLAGVFADRWGPVPVVVAANLAAAIGSLLLLSVHGFAAFVLVCFVVSGSTRAFWAAYTPLVGYVVGGDRLETWFGRFRAIRYAGIALGGGAAGLAVLPGLEVGLRVVLVLDAVSYVAAVALLVLAARMQVPGRATAESSGGTQGGYRAALTDPPNLALVGLNVLATTMLIAPWLGMPILVINQLGLPAWVAGVLAAVGTVSVAVPLLFTSRLAQGRSRVRVLAMASAFWALGSLVFLLAAIGLGAPALVVATAIVILGIGEAIYSPIADALPLALAPIGLGGRYSALHQLAWGVSSTFAPALVALLLSLNRSALWLAMAGVGLGTTVAYLVLPASAVRRAGRVGDFHEAET
jgi:MFS family permease